MLNLLCPRNNPAADAGSAHILDAVDCSGPSVVYRLIVNLTIHIRDFLVTHLHVKQPFLLRSLLRDLFGLFWCQFAYIVVDAPQGKECWLRRYLVYGTSRDESLQKPRGELIHHVGKFQSSTFRVRWTTQRKEQLPRVDVNLPRQRDRLFQNRYKRRIQSDSPPLRYRSAHPVQPPAPGLSSIFHGEIPWPPQAPPHPKSALVKLLSFFPTQI